MNLLLGLAEAGFSQTVTTGEVTGAIADATGAVVTRSLVVLKNVETGDTRTVATSSAGLYRFTFVKPGAYELSAKAAQLKSDVVRVVVRLGQVQTVDLAMKIEEATQSVTVTAAAPLLDTDNAQAIYTLNERQIEQLPLPGGDLASVAYTVPGAVINNRYGGNTNTNFVVQGIGGLSNLFTVNGADDMDPYSNQFNSGPSGLLLGANEIQEATVIQNAYEGQYGRQAGAQVNYISKSGSNTYHGNLSETYNGTVLNANDYFFNQRGQKRPHTVSNQYAASFGGRIVRDKLFFFVDTEGMRIATPGGTLTVAVPSKALQQYTLNAVQPWQVALYQQAFKLYEAAPGRSSATSVTTGTGLLQDSSGRLGCGTLSGTPTGFGGTFGKDVSCADAYASHLGRQTSEWVASARLDYNVSSRQRMFLRFKTGHGLLPPSINVISPAFNGISTQPEYEAQLNHTFSVTPRLTNNLIGAFKFFSYETRFADLAAALQAFPVRFNFVDGGTNSGKFAGIGGPPGLPNGHRAHVIQIVDDLSYSTGRHWFKAGVNYRYTRQADLQFLSFSQIPRFTFNRLTAFTSGVISSNTGAYQQNFPTTPVLHVGLPSLGFYAQDEWAATPRLKLTATLRFDRTGNPDCREHCFARLVAPFTDIQQGASIPYNQSIQAGLAHPFYEIDLIVLQPRLSFAYSPAWGKGTVIRGGVGLFTDQYPSYFASTMAGNAPARFSATIQTGLVGTGGPGTSPAIATASAVAFIQQFNSGATLAQLQKAVAPAAFAAPSFLSMPSTLRTPKSAQWSLELQHQVGQKNVFSLRYSGNYGYDLFFQGTKNGFSPTGFAGLPVSRPDPRFADVTQLTNASYSNYNGLTASLRRNFGSSLQGNVSYTWSHALDMASNGGLKPWGYDSVENQVDPLQQERLNYSNADYDVRHNLTLDFVWNIPARMHNPVLKSLLAGWSLGGKTNAFSGTPFSVINGQLGYPVLAAVTDPNIRRSCGHANITTPCFTASQFATADTQTTYGNVPRNWFRGPGYLDVDSSLNKAFAITEHTRVTIGASAFNVLNHPNLGDPNSDVSGPGLGLIPFAIAPPSGPNTYFGGPTGRIVVVMGKLSF